MRLRIASDQHFEFIVSSNFRKTEEILKEIIPPLPTDKKDILLIPGDFGLGHKDWWLSLLSKLCRRFKAVIIIAGNHFFYHNSYFNRIPQFIAKHSFPKNLHLLENDFIIIDDIIFVGSTLWTNFNNDPLAIYHAEHAMNDFKCIKYLYEYESATNYTGKEKQYVERNINGQMVVETYEKSKKYIFEVLTMFKDKKTVVITHHAPSELSVHPKYKGDLLNHAFYSNLNEEIEEYQPNLWVFGHQHNSSNFLIGDTRLINNSFGYKNIEQNKDFNPTLLVEI